ncbi:cytochrome P450 [Suillus cothurnatus]|nr:cytochrome P450 [Suillus cothurnatus]
MSSLICETDVDCPLSIARALTELVQEYGPVVSFRQGSQVIMVTGSVEAITTVMEAEGRSLVDRPPSITAGEMLPDGMCIVLARSRERFRRLRKAVHTHLQPKAAEAYNDMQHDNARKFVLDILNDSKNHQKHTARYSASVILRVTYGKSTQTAYTDPEVFRIYKVLDHFELVMRPGVYLIDREKNKSGPSFTRTLLEHTEYHQLVTDEMAYLTGTLFGAGADTASIGFPHRATQDIIWQGYRIPEGAAVYGCHWAICRDPIAFPDPDPQCWLDPKGHLKDGVCPGRQRTQCTWALHALLFWSFRIDPRPDCPINTRASDSAVSHIAPFKIDIIPWIEVARPRETMADASMF